MMYQDSVTFWILFSLVHKSERGVRMAWRVPDAGTDQLA